MLMHPSFVKKHILKKRPLEAAQHLTRSNVSFYKASSRNEMSRKQSLNPVLLFCGLTCIMYNIVCHRMSLF